MRLSLLAFPLWFLASCSTNTVPADSHEASADSTLPSSLLSSVSLDSLQSGHINDRDSSFDFYPDSLRDEDAAVLSFTDSLTCGVTFAYQNRESTVRMEFLVDGIQRFDVGYVSSSEYKEFLPCGTHAFLWRFLRSSEDGVPSSKVTSIRMVDAPDTAYSPEWTFESGWPLDLSADGWVVNNSNRHLGEYCLWAGYVRDEDDRVLRIPIAAGTSKLNFYYQFSDASPSYSGPADWVSLSSADDSMALGTTAYSAGWESEKYSRILSPMDSVVTVRFHKAEDNYSEFMVDDIRLMTTAATPQQDGIWDFEDDFYPTELSSSWIIDNQAAYEGEYSLRTRQGPDYDGNFSLQVSGADSMSFWTKCRSYYSNLDVIRVIAGGDSTSCGCSSAWKKCSAVVSGLDSVVIAAAYDPSAPLERRVDLIKLW